MNMEVQAFTFGIALGVIVTCMVLDETPETLKQRLRNKRINNVPDKPIQFYSNRR